MKDMWQRALTYFGLAEDEEYRDDFDELDEDRLYRDRTSTVRRISRTGEVGRSERAPALRTVAPPAARVHVIEPKSFNDVQKIADKFKSDIPIIMNLQDAGAELSRRMIDFGSGLTYGLDGAMQRVAEKVFLLTPSNVEVSAEEKRRLREKGFFNHL